MKIRNIFDKQIDRDIEGVIKVDDLDTLKIEVEEYVITNEIAKNLLYLLEEYNHPTQGNNGVWISGFFGSGKSHLLKMLALLLDNSNINGLSVSETLLSKVPASDAILKAEIKRALDIPANSILFNIDQKADAISKSDSDAVLGVFVKVFNEFCGYFGQHGYIAKLERDLDEQGLFEEFQINYQAISGKSWHEGREKFNLNRQKIAQAFGQTTGNSEKSAVDAIIAYREEYSLSIEDFAKDVKTYIDKQQKGFRLNFFVDEVGQYIAENVKLMTNLQTIAESLATICKGQAWLFVTSQDDMTTVLGDFGQKQSNDFSKIQARFKSQIHLSSQDVAEVIQKRLLEKNDQGRDETILLYDQEHRNFGTIFTFPDGGMSFRSFRDQEEFISSYPFIPYQYTLFQQAIETLSKHNAFTGKHNSVGERSMLGVFQEVVVNISDQPVGNLGSFDLMYEGIRNSIKSRNQSAIFSAEEHLNNTFAIKLLKALFLVKYIKGFHATPRNLRVLMQTRFDEDIRDLEKRINDALSLLERQTYIQRNDDAYEYLTEEEHDVEVEIKNTVVDHDLILKELEDIFFSEIIGSNKLRYEGNQQDYPFAKMIDEKLRGRDQELAIDFITPFNEESNNNLVMLKSHCMGKAEMMVVLPPDPKFQQDLLMYKKTETYIRQNHGVHTSDAKNMILTNKAYQNSERKRAISERAKALVSQAQFIVSGDGIEVSGEDSKSRIIKGFNSLIEKIYQNLRFLGGVQYREEAILHYLQESQNSLLRSNTIPLNEAELAMFTFIQTNKRKGERTTMKKIEEQFSAKPFGWYLAAIQCVTAQLAGRGKIECWNDGNLLEDRLLENALRNTYGFSNLIIEPVKLVEPEVIRRLKHFYSSFFNEPASQNEARPLVKEIREKTKALHIKLDEYYAYRTRYPFLSRLQITNEKVASLANRDYDYFVEEFTDDEIENWLDVKEAEFDPLINFMQGQKREIYDQLKDFVTQNKPDFNNGELTSLQDFIDDPEIHVGNKLQQARVQMEKTKGLLQNRLESARQDALGKVDELQQRMHEMQDFEKLDHSEQEQLDQSFKDVRYAIENQSLSVSIRDKIGTYEVDEYPQLLTRMMQKANKGQAGGDDQGNGKPIPQIIHVSYLPFVAPKKFLENKEDVEEYLDALRKALVKALKDNNHIQI